MRIRATKDQIMNAFNKLNKEYDGNIYISVESDKGNFNRVRLGTHDADGLGSRHSWSGRRIHSACWHVYGRFFDLLLNSVDGVIIYSWNQKITTRSDNWKDINIGSLILPVYMSETCNNC